MINEKDVFSPSEKTILKILGKKKMSILEITENIFKDEKTRPINASIVVAGMIIRINKKCNYHSFDWFLNGIGQGRGGKTVWRDKKP